LSQKSGHASIIIIIIEQGTVTSENDD